MTQLATRRMQRREYLGTDYQVEAEARTPFEVVLMPRYWAHVSSILRERDEIHIMPECRSWYAVLLVIAVGPLYARVVELSFVDIANYQAKTPALPDGYEIKHRGEKAMWCVTLERKDVRTGIQTEAEAIGLAFTHANAVAPKAAGAGAGK